MLYKYETHLHTSEVSTCATSSAQEMVEAFVKAGYAGFIVTDHFISPRRFAPLGWTWEQEMLFLYSGYQKAKEAGDKAGLSVFFGWEMSMDRADDYLTYNLPIEFLLAHPEIRSLNLAQYSKLVREAGGVLVRVHPFRQAHYIPANPTVEPELIDGIEVNNGLKDDPEQNNELAWEYAKQHESLFRTSGTDIHDTQFAGKAGMAFAQRHATMRDFADALRRDEGLLIIEGLLYNKDGTLYNDGGDE